MLDLTWTILRVSQRTPLERHGREMLSRLVAAWERVSRSGASSGPGNRQGTSAIVPWVAAPVGKRYGFEWLPRKTATLDLLQNPEATPSTTSTSSSSVASMPTPFRRRKARHTASPTRLLPSTKG